MVDERTNCAALLENALLKFVLAEKPGFAYALYMYCQETGALRKLFSDELVLKIRDEILLQNMLRKGLVFISHNPGKWAKNNNDILFFFCSGSVIVNLRCLLRMV